MAEYTTKEERAAYAAGYSKAKRQLSSEFHKSLKTEAEKIKKAMAEDSEQYELGFRDGYRKGNEELAEKFRQLLGVEGKNGNY